MSLEVRKKEKYMMHIGSRISAEILLEMQNLRLQPRPTDSESAF